MSRAKDTQLYIYWGPDGTPESKPKKLPKGCLKYSCRGLQICEENPEDWRHGIYYWPVSPDEYVAQSLDRLRSSPETDDHFSKILMFMHIHDIPVRALRNTRTIGFRVPMTGEYYMNTNGAVLRANRDIGNEKYPIIRVVQFRPAGPEDIDAEHHVEVSVHGRSWKIGRLIGISKRDGDVYYAIINESEQVARPYRHARVRYYE